MFEAVKAEGIGGGLSCSREGFVETPARGLRLEAWVPMFKAAAEEEESWPWDCSRRRPRDFSLSAEPVIFSGESGSRTEEGSGEGRRALRLATL